MSTPAWVEELVESFQVYAVALQQEEVIAGMLANARNARESAWNRIQVLARKVGEAQK